VVLAMLADGSLHLTGLRLLSPHLKDENHLALLGGAIRKTTREIRKLVARWFPRPDVAPMVRRMPRASETPRSDRGEAQRATTSASTVAPAGAGSLAVMGSAAGRRQDDAPDSAAPPRPQTAGREVARPAGDSGRLRGSVEPLAADRYAFRFTGDEETASLLEEAQELLSHTVPSGDIATIVKRGLALLVADARRRRHAATARPRVAAGADELFLTSISRDIPAEIQRLVWDRDGGRCSFVGANGWRCEERHFLQFHHLKPWITGGPATVANIALRCHAHNQYEARVYFAPIRRARSER
jgi:hypothetical protein